MDGFVSGLVGGIAGGLLSIAASLLAVRKTVQAEHRLRAEERVEERKDRKAEHERQDRLIEEERAYLREEAFREWMDQRRLAFAALSQELMMTAAAANAGRLQVALGAWVPIQDTAMVAALPYLSTLPRHVLDAIRGARFMMWQHNALVEITNARGGAHGFHNKLSEEVPILAECLTSASKAIYEYIQADLGIGSITNSGSEGSSMPETQVANSGDES